MSVMRGQLGRRHGPTAFLAGLRVRKKLIVLHTFFSLTLAGVLLMILSPAVLAVVEEAEQAEARMVLQSARAAVGPDINAMTEGQIAARLAIINSAQPGGVVVRLVQTPPQSAANGIPAGVSSTSFGGEITEGRFRDGGAAAYWPTEPGRQLLATARLEAARRAVNRLLVVLAAALLGVYALIALSLELFVLPQHVYGPIRAILRADAAVQEGRREEELVPESAIPADELGEIMRSRNDAVRALRRQETQLDQALAQLSATASDLQRKNHLLEAAQRNLADADRLASLGILSAGLAHEMNTPLAVAKGLAERLGREDGRLDSAEAALLVRVIGRLERLSESLLDFARVRPPTSRPAALRQIVEEAWTLVRLDREARGVELVNALSDTLVVNCDADRMTQVFVNLLRNAVDAVQEGASTPAGGGGGSGGVGREFQSWSADNRPVVTIAAQEQDRDGKRWVAVTVTDSGPGIDADVLGRLFEPFATTKLDSRGTGLGLAVSQGIVREHGGLLQARNRTDGRGAVFEVLLPVEPELQATRDAAAR